MSFWTSKGWNCIKFTINYSTLEHRLAISSPSSSFRRLNLSGYTAEQKLALFPNAVDYARWLTECGWRLSNMEQWSKTLYQPLGMQCCYYSVNQWKHNFKRGLYWQYTNSRVEAHAIRITAPQKFIKAPQLLCPFLQVISPCNRVSYLCLPVFKKTG